MILKALKKRKRRDNGGKEGVGGKKRGSPPFNIPPFHLKTQVEIIIQISENAGEHKCFRKQVTQID